jgi:hypothetical protein
MMATNAKSQPHSNRDDQGNPSESKRVSRDGFFGVRVCSLTLSTASSFTAYHSISPKPKFPPDFPGTGLDAPRLRSWTPVRLRHPELQF